MTTALQPGRAMRGASLLLLVLACATLEEDPDPHLEAWLGRDVDAMRQVWGLPDQSYPTGNWVFHVYRSSVPRSWRWFDTGSVSCEISFGLYRGRVSTTEWSGERWVCAKMASTRPPTD